MIDSRLAFDVLARVHLVNALGTFDPSPMPDHLDVLCALVSRGLRKFCV